MRLRHVQTGPTESPNVFLLCNSSTCGTWRTEVLLNCSLTRWFKLQVTRKDLMFTLGNCIFLISNIVFLANIDDWFIKWYIAFLLMDLHQPELLFSFFIHKLPAYILSSVGRHITFSFCSSEKLLGKSWLTSVFHCGKVLTLSYRQRSTSDLFTKGYSYSFDTEKMI